MRLGRSLVIGREPRYARCDFPHGRTLTGPELDDDMRDAGSVRQKWKSVNMRADCRKAYEYALFSPSTTPPLTQGARDAIAEMETSADALKEG